MSMDESLFRRVVTALQAAESYLEVAANPESGYGGFHGGDPRDFHPDPECSTDAERAAHDAAVAAMDRGESVTVPPQMTVGDEAQAVVDSGDFDSATVVNGKVVTAHRYHFGLGTYQIRDREAEEALSEVRDALATLRRDEPELWHGAAGTYVGWNE